MYGAIIGDLAGSIYEYQEFKDSLKKKVDLKRRLEILHKKELISENAFYSDDTILTISILESILEGIGYEENLKKYALMYKEQVPEGKYFKYMFSEGFIKWCNSNIIGTSKGNGAMMRISPVGYLFNTEDEIMEESEKATKVSHNDDISLMGAAIISLMIYYARIGMTKKEIETKINLFCNVDYNFDIDKLRNTNGFTYTCEDTLPLVLYSIFNTNSFEDAIRVSISLGGDTDTVACIVGSVAEALYGVPEELKKEANKFLPLEFQKILVKGYSRIKKLV